MANWLELVKTKFTIITGDGKSHTPNMLNANIDLQFNVSEFNFRNLRGTLVDKQQPMGEVYNLELIFQGADHVTTAAAFRLSAKDKRPWTITHPLYGKLNVQPIQGLFFDNAENLANTTKITGPVRETIGKAKLVPTQSAAEVIQAAKITTDNHFATDYVNAVPAPKVKDVNAMKANTNGVYATMSKITAGANQIKNAYNNVNAGINNAIANVGNAISGIQAFISLPAFIDDTIAHRLVYLANEFNFLLLQAGVIDLPTLKHLYMNNAGTCITSMCATAVYNISPTDYLYSSSALNAISIIVANYNSYLTSLDTLQTVNGGALNSFVPDAITIAALDNLVNYTISALFDIAAQAKQQRTLNLTRDSNWINIAYQIYGLLPDDSTITAVMADNNAGLNEVLQVRKGRKILYYV